MPSITVKVPLVTQKFENELLLTESPCFREVSTLATQAPSIRRLEQHFATLIGSDNPIVVFRRRLGGKPELVTRQMLVRPDVPSETWRGDMELHFTLLKWNHGKEAILAFAPALQLELVFSSEDEFEATIDEQIREALIRLRRLDSIVSLVHLQRAQSVDLDWTTVEVTIPTPKQKALDERSLKEAQTTVLPDFADNLNARRLTPIFESENDVKQLAELINNQAGGILMVGPSGCGKSATFEELVRLRHQHGLGDRQFWVTSGSRMIAGQSGFGMWQQRCQDLLREAARKRLVLHVGNLMELSETGKSSGSSIGIASFLKTAIERGQLLAVAECTEAQFTLIEQQDPQLLQAFTRLSIKEPDRAKGRSILQRASDSWSGASIRMSADALDAIDWLHRRYATYSAYPGRPLYFLKRLITDYRPQSAADDSLVTVNKTHIMQAFSEQTGLPKFLLDESITLDLAEMKRWFRERVIGQDTAVDLVCDMITTIKAGLSREDRPIASFLFVGPTGVGKTEMAKTISRYLYQDVQRMIRIDMSEYADPFSVERLIGGRTKTNGLLTSKVREQPFSLLLLDEFEKADPSFFDILLQVLGEGRLTDSVGRIADFRNTIIIMTSNLGVESSHRPSVGFGDSPRQDMEEHFLKKVREFVRPEFFNRLDRVVSFEPLAPATIEKIASRELEAVLLRDGVRYRGIDVELDDGLPGWLSNLGFDARYGARPIKRAIEQHVVRPLAKKINRYNASSSLFAQLRVAGEQLECETSPQHERAGQTRGKVETSVAVAVVAQRRLAEQLVSCHAARAVSDRVYRLKEIQRRSKQRKKSLHYLDENELYRLAALVDGIQSVKTDSDHLEDETLGRIYRNEPMDADHARSTVEQLRQRVDDFAMQLFLRENPQGDQVTLVLLGQYYDRLLEVWRCYQQLCQERQFTTTCYSFFPHHSKSKAKFKLSAMTSKGKEPIVDLFSLEDPFLLPQAQQESCLGIAIEVRGQACFPMLASEQGIHSFKEAGATVECVVQSTKDPVSQYQPNPKICRKEFFEVAKHQFSPRRAHDSDAQVLYDVVLKERVDAPRGTAQSASVEFIKRLFYQRVTGVLGTWT